MIRTGIDHGIVNKILERPGQNVLVIGHSNGCLTLSKCSAATPSRPLTNRSFDDLFIVTIYAKAKHE
jgi:hypothetical protein